MYSYYRKLLKRAMGFCNGGIHHYVLYGYMKLRALSGSWPPHLEGT